MADPKIITGKVAKRVTNHDLAINRGSNDGVETGMVFVVLDKSTLSIKDPDTGEDLGGVRRVKARLRVVNVGERASILEETRYAEDRERKLYGLTGLSTAFLPATPSYGSASSILALDPEPDWLSGVVVGDLVEQVPPPAPSSPTVKRGGGRG